MASSRFLACCLAGFLSVVAFAAHGEAVLRPLPKPDTSKLPSNVAEQLNEAAAEFEKVKLQLLGKDLAEAYAVMGAAYAAAGLNDVADIAFYDASQLAPTDGRWPYVRGVLARQAKRNTDARNAFESALALDKNYLPIRYRLADTLIDLNDLDGARKVLETAAQERPEAAPPRAMLGQLALRQKRYADAIEQLNAALKLEPQANELYKYLAEAYTAQGNTQAAQQASAKAGTTPPAVADPLIAGIYRNAVPGVGGKVEKTVAPPATLRQASDLFAAGRIAAAREAVNQILQKNGDDTDALALGARIEATAGNPFVAQAQIEGALKLKPNDGNVLMSRGVVYEFSGDEAHAIEFYQRAIQADPKQADAQLLLGNAEMRRNRYPQAVERYRQVVAVRPDDATAHAHLAAALVASGKCDEALAQINSALARRSNDGDLLQIFVRLASTCSAAKPEERDMALDYAQTIYKARPDATDCAALALALAAHGKYKEAQQYQAEAIFQAVRAGDKNAAAMYRATQAIYVANKVPDRPWSADDLYFKPPLLAPLRTAAPAPAAPAKK
ncbi:MAG TPA: tetratricopeptide repeat protein [Rudaea sp.]